jgi:hypothetical protein
MNLVRLGFVFALFSWNVFAQSRFGLFGLQNRTRFESAGSNSEWGVSVGYGLSWELPASEGSGWEIGASSYARKWGTQSQYQNILIPLLHNFWLGPYLGAGLGGYFSKGSRTLTLSGTALTFDTAEMRSTDFGAVAALKINLPFEIRGLSLMLEGRYHYGLANASRINSIKSRFDDFQFLVGLKFGTLGSKTTQSKEEKK